MTYCNLRSNIRNYESEKIMLVGRVIEGMQNEIDSRKILGVPVQPDYMSKFYRISERLYDLCHDFNYRFKLIEKVYNSMQEDITQKFVSKDDISEKQMQTYFRVKDRYNSLKKQRDALAKWNKETPTPRTPIKHKDLDTRLVA